MCHWDGVLQMASEPLPSLRWGEHAQAHRGRKWTLAGTDAKNGLIP
jgi:hypothetical protein